MTIKFLTYGDQAFKNSRMRIKKEAVALEYFDEIVVHTEETIRNIPEFQEAQKNEEFNEVFASKRGGGYWMWKPLVIYHELKKMKDGDRLYYADAGCTIPNHERAQARLRKAFTITGKNCQGAKTGIYGFRNPYTEKHWTKGDVFSHFNVTKDTNICDTRQITANRIVIRKCNASMKIIKLWADTAIQHPHLFSDSASVSENKKGFRENRHDQSVWSVIAKKYDIAQNYVWNNQAIVKSCIRG